MEWGGGLVRTGLQQQAAIGSPLRWSAVPVHSRWASSYTDAVGDLGIPSKAGAVVRSGRRRASPAHRHADVEEDAAFDLHAGVCSIAAWRSSSGAAYGLSGGARRTRRDNGAIDEDVTVVRTRPGR